MPASSSFTKAATGRRRCAWNLWVERQADKIARALAALEDSPPEITDPPDIGQIALACLLGYRDLRFSPDWRKDHPKLAAWLEQFAAAVPAFAETKAEG